MLCARRRRHIQRDSPTRIALRWAAACSHFRAIPTIYPQSTSMALRFSSMNRGRSKEAVVGGGRFPNNRCAPRYCFVAAAELLEPVGRSQITGHTSTISDIGCQVRSVNLLTAGTIVQLKIEQHGKIFETWARVSSVNPELGMGLSFLDTEPAHRETLRGWIEQFQSKLEE